MPLEAEVGLVGTKSLLNCIHRIQKYIVIYDRRHYFMTEENITLLDGISVFKLKFWLTL